MIITKFNPDDVMEMLKIEGYTHIISYDFLMNWLIETPINIHKLEL